MEPSMDQKPGLSRDICTMTTLPLGASMEDLDMVQSDSLDMPLVGLVKRLGMSASQAELVQAVSMWVERRHDLGDIAQLDPQRADAVCEVSALRKQLADRESTLNVMVADRQATERKLDLAASTMLARQHTTALELFPGKVPEETDFYKAHMATINSWKTDKIAPFLEAELAFTKVSADMTDQLRHMVDHMIETAAMEPETDANPIHSVHEVDATYADTELMKDLDDFVRENYAKARSNTYAALS